MEDFSKDYLCAEWDIKPSTYDKLVNNGEYHFMRWMAVNNMTWYDIKPIDITKCGF